jgi:hypothetical protein
MAKFNVSSGHPTLVGECHITGVAITKYVSNDLGKATNIENNGSGSDLHAKVTFDGAKKAFTIMAKKNASGNFHGNADNDNGPFKATEETWAATSTGEEAVAAKAY